MYTHSTSLFSPDTKIIFFFEERIGEVIEKPTGFVARSLDRKIMKFSSHNLACDFLKYCHEKVIRKKADKIIEGQFNMEF